MDSRPALELLNQFDDFKLSIKNMADLGCGDGSDLEYWANMRDTNIDGTPGKYLDIGCYGVDLNCKHIEPQRHNIKYRNHDLNSDVAMLPVSVDVVWCHDVMQYIYSPVEFLGRVNSAMNMGGMLYLSVPSTINVVHHMFKNYTPPGHLNTFTITQLLYLLGLNGFDIKDYYLQKLKYDDVIQVVVYKERDPLPYDTSWYAMTDMDIVSDNMREIIMRNGILGDQGLVTTWLDGTVQDYRWHT